MPRWQIEVSHPGLNKSRIITGNDKAAVERKVLEQKRIWHQQHLISLNTQLASLKTEEVKARIRAIQTMVAEAIASSSEHDWDALKGPIHFQNLRTRHPGYLNYRRNRSRRSIVSDGGRCRNALPSNMREIVRLGSS